MAILGNIGRFFSSAFNAWLMKPVYQIAIVILIIVLVAMYMKNQKLKNAA